MSQVEAVYRRGVFQPLGPVNLPEEQHVRLNFEPEPKKPPLEWLREIQAFQESVSHRTGILPDSAPDIAADRLR